MKELLYLKDEQIKDFIRLIFYSYKEIFSDPKEILSKKLFGLAHLRALYLIEQFPGIGVSELMFKLKITKQSLSRVLNQLVKEDYIIVSTGTDKRTKRLSLTNKGNKLEIELSSIQINRIKKVLNKFSENNINGFKKILYEMINVKNKNKFIKLNQQ